MIKTIFIAIMLSQILGCKKKSNGDKKTLVHSSMPISSSETSVAQPLMSEWRPIVQGVPYQLSLKNGVFGFCDKTGAQQIDLASGKQTVVKQNCDSDHEIVQSSCDEAVDISGSSEGGNDVIAINGQGYVLSGHDHACDRDGQTLIAGTIGAVEVIDSAANKVAIVDPGGGDRAVIGSGWVAWSTLNRKRPLRLETLAKAMEQAATPK